jgi:nitroreductase
MNKFIENAQWRYATKKYDSSKKISAEDLSTLKKAMQLSASSFGLQPYKILIVDNPEIRKQLQPASWNQSQIVDASHVIVFANYIDFNNDLVDAHIQNTAQTRNIAVENLVGYGSFVKSKLNEMNLEQKNNWTAKQTYIALTNLLNAASSLNIDATPMEGFEPEKYNEILGLNKLNLNASVVATIGYRSEEDLTQHLAKVRKPENELFITL